jgi:transcriptional regulator with PAS, ATPase and Fis domain
MLVAMSKDTTALITGESGTGKEVVAQLIHRLSPRHQHPFLEVNCAAIPAELLESELFGHEAGAFTDAKEAKRGLFEVADQGTLFLDEIGEMSQNLQAKLLRFLERQTFRHVGGTRDLTVDLRILSATNRDLREMVAARQFREDLFYRLNVVPLRIPPLRDRREDILPLIGHFLGEFNARFNKNFSRIDDAARRILMDYPWPGNIRELRNIVERVVLMEQGPELSAGQLRPLLSGSWEQIPETFPRRLARWLEEPIPEEGFDLEGVLKAVERSFIAKAYRQAGENQSRAAEMLGLGRDKLRYRMKQLDAEAPVEEGP